jgi:hypothetical protein
MSEQPKDSSFEILSLFRSVFRKLPSDDHRAESVTRLAEKYSFLIKHFLKSDVKQHAELKKARANYLTAHASVVRLFSALPRISFQCFVAKAAFLAGVQMGFISLTTSGSNLNPSSTIQRVIHIFSFCAISCDILGVLSALTTAQNLLQIYSAMDQFLQIKADVEGRMYQPLHDLQASGHAGAETAGEGRGSKKDIENLIIEVHNITQDLGVLDHEMERHANDNASALLIIFLGVICFFVSLITFIINSQPKVVWISTVVMVAAVIGIVLSNGNFKFRHSRRWDAIKLWARGFFVSVRRWNNCKQLNDEQN